MDQLDNDQTAKSIDPEKF
jgi:ATP-binding cassette subfamily B (MDR/TAP) protein 1